MAHWQMRLEELEGKSFVPAPKTNPRNGMTDWFCSVCGNCVGIYSNGRVHDEGWMYKRKACINGHEVDWEGAD